MIVNYIGSDSKVGTTMIAASTAKLLGDDTILICKPGAAGSQYEHEKVELWPEEDLHPRNVKKIITTISDEYTNIIIDSGSDIHSGLAVGAIESADVNIVIATQQKSAMDRLKNLVSGLLKPMNIKAELLVNKYIDGAFASVSEIEQIGGFSDAFCIRYSQYGWEAEKEEATLLKYPGFYKDMKKYIKLLLDEEKKGKETEKEKENENENKNENETYTEILESKH